MRILITGSSGFIGTNLMESLVASGQEVLGIDIRNPQVRSLDRVHRSVDILDKPALHRVFQDFAPTHVIHLAARTDLHETRSLAGYAANVEGVANMVECISGQPSVKRSVFASTKLVCPTDYSPKSDEDYCPTTRYGESKVRGEQIVRSSRSLKGHWCLVRPTSIWGPWSNLPHIPYCRFFRMIAKGCYWHLGHANPAKSFGFVGNTIFQIMKLVEAPAEKTHSRVFYISDYETCSLREWADMISIKLRGRPVRTLPEPLVWPLAWMGDLAKLCGSHEPPLSSFRLRNMRACTATVPLEPTRQISGPLPFSLAQGVDAMIAWLMRARLIH